MHNLFILKYLLYLYSLIYISISFFSDLELKPVGKLDVKLVQAKGLTNKDLIGKSDPYAVLYVRPVRDRTKKSKTIVSGWCVSFQEFSKSYLIKFYINVNM